MNASREFVSQSQKRELGWGSRAQGSREGQNPFGIISS